ncbi:MAG TPA: hypothetical protein VFI61_01170 [Patescibacteria group bacterium]|nr:hypothetical protein [Patescibacteria group bacterium]
MKNNSFQNYLLKLKQKVSSIAGKLHSDRPFFGQKFALLIIGVFIIAILFGMFKLLGKSSKVQVQDAKAAQAINNEFEFPLKDAKGVEVGKIKFEVENAELRDEIIVKGQRATSVSGRTFLILNLKIGNTHNQAIEITTRDYVRLSKNGDKAELLAPDIHNDPVEIQAISTKYTRVGFAINDSDKDLVLRIGEINGDKQEVPINF